MKLRKYTIDQLTSAVENSASLRQVLENLNVAAYGGNYAVLRHAIKYFNLDTSHFKGQGWRKGTYKSLIPIEEFLSNNRPVSSFKLKNKLLKEKLLEYRCSFCGLTEWLGKPIPLELDHINGNNKDNSLENLRLLCPNCHALTPNYRGKNKRLSINPLLMKTEKNE
jgi:hypothetical protein